MAIKHLFDLFFLKDVGYAARAAEIKELPSEAQAAKYFGKLVDWRAEGISEDLLGLSDETDKGMGNLIGQVLAHSVVPALPAEALNEEDFEKLWAFYAEAEAPEAIISFPHFAAMKEIFADRVEKIIRLELQSRDPSKVACSSYALLKWKELSEFQVSDRLISRLIYMIEANRLIGLPALLWTANQLHNKGSLLDADINSLTEILPTIFASADYKNVSPSSRESVSVSLVRSACVVFARDILSRNQDKNNELLRILDEAKVDSLPEVRFA